MAEKASKDLRVFVIWFNMYPGDAEARWPREAFHDPRVTQRWDEAKTAGRWFLAHLPELRPSRGGDGIFPQRVDALWDTYLLFGHSGRSTDLPHGLLSWGYPVMRTRGQLAADLLFAAKP